MCFINSTCQPCYLSWVSQGCVQDLHSNFVEHFYRKIIEDETLFLSFCLVTLIWYWGVWYSFPLSSLLKATVSQQCRVSRMQTENLQGLRLLPLLLPSTLPTEISEFRRKFTFSWSTWGRKGGQRAANEAFSHNFLHELLRHSAWVQLTCDLRNDTLTYWCQGQIINYAMCLIFVLLHLFSSGLCLALLVRMKDKKKLGKTLNEFWLCFSCEHECMYTP